MTIRKTADVFTNDANHSEFHLSLTGHVGRLFTLTPQYVLLKGIAGESIKKIVTLVPDKKHPFALTGIRAKHGDNIKYRYKEIKTGNNVQYKIYIENACKQAGMYFDTLYLKTDSKLKPVIRIAVYGNISTASAQKK